MFGWLIRNRKPEPVNAGAALAKIGKQQRRALVHAKADEMRANAGLPPVEWPAL